MEEPAAVVPVAPDVAAEETATLLFGETDEEEETSHFGNLKFGADYNIDEDEDEE